MKQSFIKDFRMSKSNQEYFSLINEIIDEFIEQGYRLTLRQLYYQLVSRGIIENRVNEYRKLGRILVKGRMAGVVDWRAIEDRSRIPYIRSAWDNPQEIINSAIHSYRRNRQENQEVYIELWVEKDALSGILGEITREYHITLMVNKGYSSCSAMYESFCRFKEMENQEKETHILYLGDFDPSGLDMIRDIKDRLSVFGVFPKVKHIGLVQEQIKRFNPPPNPAKITDPRAKWYIEKYGNTSWEVDALNPKTLHKLIRKNIDNLIDVSLMNDSLLQEIKDKEWLKKISKRGFKK